MEITFRKAHPEEHDACIDLVNYVFSHDHCPHDFEKMIPRVYGPGKNAAELHRVAVDGTGRLWAAIACLPESLTVCGHELRAGFIGSVSVHPRARGEGFMKRLMADWDEELRESCDLAVLSGQRQRYEYFGYTSGGLKLFWTVNDANVRHALHSADDGSFSFRPLAESPEALALAQELHLRRPARVYRAPVLFEEGLRSFGMHPLAVLKKGKAAGYLTASSDSRTINEIALDDNEDLGPVIKAFFACYRPGHVTITASATDTALNRRLETFAESWRLEASEMIRIYRFAPVLEAYLTLRQKTLGLMPGEWSAVLAGQPVTVHVTGAGVTVEEKAAPGAPELDQKQAQSLLLSPQSCLQDGLPPPAGSRFPSSGPRPISSESRLSSQSGAPVLSLRRAGRLFAPEGTKNRRTAFLAVRPLCCLSQPLWSILFMTRPVMSFG